MQASSPACTELETIVMNWLGKMIGLPEEFLHTKVDSRGGGVIQVSTLWGNCVMDPHSTTISMSKDKVPTFITKEFRQVIDKSSESHLF